MLTENFIRRSYLPNENRLGKIIHRAVKLHRPIRSTFGTSTLLLAISIWLAGTMNLPAPVHEDENATPAAKEPARQKPKHSSERSQSGEATDSKSSRPSGKARNLSGPKAEYPPEALPLKLSGTGQYVLHFDQKTGMVTDVTVAQSTGSDILDQAAIKAFRQWHEDPNCAKEVTMTHFFSFQTTPAP
jgi:TonB family protein